MIGNKKTTNMKRLFSTLLVFALVGMVSCEEPTTTPNTPSDTEQEEQNPTDNPGEDPEPEPEPEPEPTPEIDPLPEATYQFKENIYASIFTLQTDGKRNDYLAFYDEYTQHSLFIDFYNDIDKDHLYSGVYPLGDGSVGTCDQQYTYFTLYKDAELWRFTEGKATVITDTKHESGYVWYTISAYFTLESGETVSLWYEGQPTVKNY